MQDEKAQYGQNGTSSIKYNTKNNEWILDCWGSEAVNAYLWMDKDVYGVRFLRGIRMQQVNKYLSN